MMRCFEVGSLFITNMGSMKIIIELMLRCSFGGFKVPCHLWCYDKDSKLTNFHLGRKLVWTNIS